MSVITIVLYILEILLSIRLGYIGMTDQSLFLAPMAVLLFLLALRIEWKWHPKTLRKMSTIIYCAQGNIILIAGFIYGYLKFDSTAVLLAIGLLLEAVMVFLLLWSKRILNTDILHYII